MKRIGLIIFALLLCFGLRAQEQQDSTVVAAYDVFDRLSSNLEVEQSPAIREAVNAHVERNERRAASGLAGQTYRIRIYFDSGQGARSGSEAAAARFRNRHPGVPVSRTFTDPFFKVTVGEYSSKAEAAAALKNLQQEFPTAFIVRN